MLLSKYGCHTAIQTSLYCTYHSKITNAFVICVPTAKMPIKWYLYKNCLTSTNGGSMPIYIPHINSLTSKVLYTEDNDDNNNNDAG